MTEENDSVWQHDSLTVDVEGYVTGSAYTQQQDGYTVDVGVTSYEMDDGELNHVPNVVLSDQHGNIIAEPHAHDSTSGQRAIENAKSTGEYVYENMEEFI